MLTGTIYGDLLSGSSVPLSVYSGLICLGAGDTAASIVGSMHGRHQWPS